MPRRTCSRRGFSWLFCPVSGRLTSFLCPRKVHKVNTIPTALTHDELYALWRLAEGRLVYEAGSLLGASTIALAQTARLVVAVDPHDGYPRKDPSPTWELFDRNLRTYGVRGKVQPIRATLADAPPKAAYDLAFADLTGEHDVTMDFLMAARYVKMVAVHDYGRAGCEGATRAVDQWLKTFKRRVTRVDTLIILEDTWKVS